MLIPIGQLDELKRAVPITLLMDAVRGDLRHRRPSLRVRLRARRVHLGRYGARGAGAA